MLKNILNVDGAEQLSANAQKAIKGGVPICFNQCGPTGGVPDKRFPGQCICY